MMERETKKRETKNSGEGSRNDQLTVIIGPRETKRASSPQRERGASDCEPQSPRYVDEDYTEIYRGKQANLNRVFEQFIRKNLRLGGLDKINALQNTEECPFNMISINSDSDFCDRKEDYLKIPGFFGRLAICCSLATRRENISVLFLGNVLGKTKAKRKIISIKSRVVRTCRYS